MAMRPIPPISTDLIYSDHFRKDDLVAVGEALGTSDIKNITTATAKPDRVLYHACLNGIQTYVRLKNVDEAPRAQEIADLADSMYTRLIDQYRQNLASSTPALEQKNKEAARFCEKMHEIESRKHWDPVRFANTWNTNDYPPRWQKKAIESYAAIRSRIESGEYTPPSGETAGTLTQYWCQRNVEYKHYRDNARTPVEKHIQTELPKESLLTMHPADERIMTMFIGSMGSGKSEMTKHYVSQLPDDVRGDIVLHNADYLKYALFRSAVHEGALPAEHHFKGPETQAESSNALYEGTRKRAFIARQKFEAPNAVLNSIVLGSFEVLEGIAGGGKVMAHHLFISPEEAVKEARLREEMGGRAPDASDVLWSSAASAKSLLLLTQPTYRGTDVTVHLYKRGAGKAPLHYGTIDAAKSVIHVQDIATFAKLSKSAFPEATSDQEALKNYLGEFNKAGFTIALARQEDLEATVATLAPDGKLSIIDPAGLEAHGTYGQTLRDMASSTQVGSTALLAKPAKGALNAQQR